MKKLLLLLSIMGLFLIGCNRKTETVEIIFETNGGTPISTITDKSNLDFNNLPVPMKEGCTFIGWYLDPELTKDIESNIPEDYELTLYAKWEAITYQVTYDSNGGSTVDSDTVVIHETLTPPTPPTKTGYRFIGWYNDPSLENPYDFTNSITDPLTLYAKWEINQYTISFVSNAEISVTSITADYNKTINAPEIPIRNGYTFVGWYLDEDLTIPYTFNKMPAENITLYAKWYAGDAAVHFDTNGGNIIDPITAEIGSTISPPQPPTKEGYDFDGWYTDVNLTNAFTDWIIPVGSITLYAKWTPAIYKISFDSLGGSTVSEIDAPYLSKVIKPSDPVKEGYYFDGWYTDLELTTRFNFDEMPALNITLYASWIDLREGMPINYIKTKENHSEIITKGVVTSILGDNYLGFYIKDHTGDIFVNFDQSNVSIGDEVRIYGNFLIFNGIPMLVNISQLEIINQGTPLEPTEELSINEINALDSLNLNHYARFIKTSGILVYRDHFYYLEDGLGNHIKISHYSYTPSTIASLDASINQYVEIYAVLHQFDDSWTVTFKLDSLQTKQLSDREKLDLIASYISNTYHNQTYRPFDTFFMPTTDQYGWSTISYQVTGSNSALFDELNNEFLEPFSDTTIDFEVHITVGNEETTLLITVQLHNSVTTILEFINVTDMNYYTIIGTIIFTSTDHGFSLISDETGTIYIENANFSIGDQVKITAYKSVDHYFVYIDSNAISHSQILSSNNQFNNTPTTLNQEPIDETDSTIYGQYVEVRGFLILDDNNYVIYNDDYEFIIKDETYNAELLLAQYEGIEVFIRGYLLYKNNETVLSFFGYRNEISIPDYTDEELIYLLQKLFINEYGDKVFYPYEKFELPAYHKILGGNISWSFSTDTMHPDTYEFIEVDTAQTIQIDIVIEKNQAQLAFTYTTTLEPFPIDDLEYTTEWAYINGIVLFHNDEYTFVKQGDTIIKIDGNVPGYKGDQILAKVYTNFREAYREVYLDRYDSFFIVQSRYNQFSLEPAVMDLADFKHYSVNDHGFYNQYIEVNGQLIMKNGKLLLTDGQSEVYIQTCDSYTRIDLEAYLEQNIKIKAYVQGLNTQEGIWTIYFTGLNDELDTITQSDAVKQDIIQTYITQLYQNQYYVGSNSLDFVSSHPFIESTISYVPLGEHAIFVDVASGYIYPVNELTEIPIEVTVNVNDTVNTFMITLTLVPYGSDTKEITSISDFKQSNGETLIVRGVVISVGPGYFLIHDDTGRIFVETDTYYTNTSLGKLVEITGKLENYYGRKQIDKDHEINIVGQNQITLINYPETSLGDIVKHDFYDETQYGKDVTITGILSYKYDENYNTYFYLTDGYDEIIIDSIQSYRFYNYVGFEVSVKGFIYGQKQQLKDYVWAVNVINNTISIGDYSTDSLIDIIGNGIIEDYDDTYYDSLSNIYFPQDHYLLYNAQITYQVMNDENQVIDLNQGQVGTVLHDTSFEIKVTVTLNNVSKDFTFTIHVRHTTPISIDELINPSSTLPYDDVYTKVHYFYNFEGTKYFIHNGKVYVLNDNYNSLYGIDQGNFVYIKGIKNIIDDVGGYGYQIDLINTDEYSDQFAIQSTPITLQEIYHNYKGEDLTDQYLKVYGQLLYDHYMEMYYITDGENKLYIRTRDYEAYLMSYYTAYLEDHLYNELYLEVLFPNKRVRGDIYIVDYKSTDTSLSYPDLNANEKVIATLSYLEKRFDGNTYSPNDSLWLPNTHRIYNTTILWSTSSSLFEDNSFKYVDATTPVTFTVIITYNENDEYYTTTSTITVYIEPKVITPIIDVLRGAESQEYTIQGIIVAYDTWYYRMYIQDDTGIILVYNYWEGLEVGDEIIVSGYRGNYYFGNTPFIEPRTVDLLSIVSHDNPVIDDIPTVLTLEEINNLDYNDPETYSQRVTVSGTLQKIYNTYFLRCDGFTIDIDYMIDASYDGRVIIDQLVEDEIEITGYLIGYETISNENMWFVTFSGDPSEYQVINEHD